MSSYGQTGPESGGELSPGLSETNNNSLVESNSIYPNGFDSLNMAPQTFMGVVQRMGMFQTDQLVQKLQNRVPGFDTEADKMAIDYVLTQRGVKRVVERWRRENNVKVIDASQTQEARLISPASIVETQEMEPLKASSIDETQETLAITKNNLTRRERPNTYQLDLARNLRKAKEDQKRLARLNERFPVGQPAFVGRRVQTPLQEA